MSSPKIMLLAAFGLCACNPASAPQGDARTGPSSEPATAAPAPATAATRAALWNDGQAKPLDIQVAHANGVVLQLTSLQSRATDTGVGLRIINGRDRDIDLNRFARNRNGYLLLDNGERLYLSPPATNTRLTVPAGQTFEGDLVFLGRLAKVNAAVLVLNENNSGDNEHTTTPGFRIDLPVAAGGGTAQ